MLTHIDLFSGVGGFALSAKWCGIKTIQFVEIDPFCRKVLNKNFPGVPIHDDIKTFTYTPNVFRNGSNDNTGISGSGEQISESGNGCRAGDFPVKQARPFLLTGGFPCQPYSCAGKRRGKEDDRALWPEMLRVVSEAKPTWIIGENVAGFINMGLDDCISDLENQGYEVQAFVVPACAVNAPHRRDRVWIVAHSKCGGSKQRHTTPRESFTVNRCGNRDASDAESGEAHPTEPGGLHAEPCGKDSDVTDTDRFNGDDARHGAGEISQFQKAEIFRGEFDTGTSNERLPGRERHGSHEQGHTAHGSAPECNSAWDEPWIEAATRLCRVDDGISRRVDNTGRIPIKSKKKNTSGRIERLKSLGNAIVPQIALELMKAIIEVEKANA